MWRNEVLYMGDMSSWDLNFENKLIEDYAKETYEEFLSHADRRQLDSAYVVNKFLSELQSLARKDEFIK